MPSRIRLAQAIHEARMMTFWGHLNRDPWGDPNAMMQPWPEIAFAQVDAVLSLAGKEAENPLKAENERLKAQVAQMGKLIGELKREVSLERAEP